MGTLIGLGVSVLFPWPWPHASVGGPGDPGSGWNQPQFAWKLPTGAGLWPAWEPPDWAPPGSWQLGSADGLVGALAGMFVIRALKFLFEYGFDQEAVGLGDADLLMMAGAFLGWQPVVLAFPVGAFLTLLVLPFIYVADEAVWAGRSHATSRSARGWRPAWSCAGSAGRRCSANWSEPCSSTRSCSAFGTVTMFGLLLVAGLLLKRTLNAHPRAWAGLEKR